jgi:hypothetical protein
MKNFCLCCGKEIMPGLFQSSSCMECIKAGCTGVAFYTVDKSPRWCKVHDKPAAAIETTCLCGKPATINGAWCDACFP